MAKTLYTVKVFITGNEKPYLYQFDHGITAWDFAHEVEKMPGVVEVVQPDWPTTMYGKQHLATALASIRDMASFAHSVK